MRFLKLLALLGAGILSASMVGLFAGAAIAVWRGVLDILRHSHDSGVRKVLEGIEYLFLAPIPLLVYWSVVQWLRSLINRESGESSTAMVHMMKAAVAFLVVSILLTDLLGKAVSGTIREWLALVAEVSAAIVAIAYLVVLQRFARGK